MAISNEAVQALLQTHFPNAKIKVEGDGYKYITHVSTPSFAGKSTLQRHKLVYAALNDAINSGELHALSIKATAPDEAQ